MQWIVTVVLHINAVLKWLRINNEILTVWFEWVNQIMTMQIIYLIISITIGYFAWKLLKGCTTATEESKAEGVTTSKVVSRLLGKRWNPKKTQIFFFLQIFFPSYITCHMSCFWISDPIPSENSCSLWWYSWRVFLLITIFQIRNLSYIGLFILQRRTNRNW